MATIAQALRGLGKFPLDDSTLEVIAANRELTLTDNYTKTIGESQSYKLAKADVYMTWYRDPNIREQDIALTFDVETKEGLRNLADKIYLEFDDENFSGRKCGFIGENWNG